MNKGIYRREMERLTNRLLLASFLFILSSCSNSLRITDWEKGELLGPVKYVQEMRYDALIRDGEVYKGMRIREPGHDYTQTFYNRKGNITGLDKYHLYDLFEEERYKYGRKGITKETMLSRSDGTILHKRVSVFDRTGKELSSTQYRPDGEEEYYWTYDYDNNGRLTQSTKYFADGRHYIAEKFKYNEEENQVEYARCPSYISTPCEFEKISVYDDSGRLIESAYYTSPGKQITRRTFKYDSEGRLIETQYYTSRFVHEGTWNYDYINDSNGNWIRRVKSENGRPKIITEREINYYN